MANNSIREAISRLWQNVLSHDDANLTEAKSYADSVGEDIKNDLLNGAGRAYDTLKELSELITDNTDAIDALETVATNKADKEHTHNYAGAATPGGAAIKSDKLTTPRNIDISGRVSGSATFDGSGDINISTIDTQRISDHGYAADEIYYKLGTMVAPDDANKGSISINGRLGGWQQTNSAYFNFMLLNRGRGVDYTTISSSVLAIGSVDEALVKNDIVVYKQPDTSADVYLKTYDYWAVDFNWNAYQHTVEYVREPVTPTGTLVWSLSTAPKVIIDHEGNVSAASFKGNAASATIASKLSNTDQIGSDNKPVYFSASGVPVACETTFATQTALNGLSAAIVSLSARLDAIDEILSPGVVLLAENKSE